MRFTFIQRIFFSRIVLFMTFQNVLCVLVKFLSHKYLNLELNINKTRRNVIIVTFLCNSAIGSSLDRNNIYWTPKFYNSMQSHLFIAYFTSFLKRIPGGGSVSSALWYWKFLFFNFRYPSNGRQDCFKKRIMIWKITKNLSRDFYSL